MTRDTGVPVGDNQDSKVAGPEGEVVATDISPEMLAYGRERASAAGFDNIDFVEADASSLDFRPESFDAALSRWGIIFEPQAEAAAGRIRGFLKSGARMAISSWGPPDRVPMTTSVPSGQRIVRGFDARFGTISMRPSRSSTVASPSATTSPRASPMTVTAPEVRLTRTSWCIVWSKI